MNIIRNLASLFLPSAPAIVPARAPGVRMAIVDFGGTGADLTTMPAIAAALTVQAQQHFALPPPYGYGIGASVRWAGVPANARPDEWVIGLVARPDQPGALGYHAQTPGGKPFIKVFPILDRQDGGILSVTISHEVCEALADPCGTIASQWSDGKFWALEVCDAVEQLSYMVNGVPMSDFCTPAYFSPIQNTAGLKFDWMGKVTKPLQILPGGYAQWFDPSQGWQQVLHQQQAPRAYRMRGDGRQAARRARYSQPE